VDVDSLKRSSVAATFRPIPVDGECSVALTDESDDEGDEERDRDFSLNMVGKEGWDGSVGGRCNPMPGED
jgi:hypothetical protein